MLGRGGGQSAGSGTDRWHFETGIISSHKLSFKIRFHQTAD